MIHIALWEPEIPPNTGNIARSCAATGSTLHLIGRLGFSTSDKAVRRAGMDYWAHVDIRYHDTFADFEAVVGTEHIICIETNPERIYTEARYQDGDCLLFGNESKGLPESIRERFADRTFRIPMPTGKVRSLNLATTVGIVLYDALRQTNNW
ncbi:tRNA (cytidine(34)-2'-O)-methyltransferase [Zavarzinella formosa]|uniref:tRNA (cytidine(34)-2'-O)-methyltransferase n=1 Tax=Zavarzinella formosa TaxID=360055 RepID=UPI00030ABED1|nr:tRNA (cytidine(34)-2'-O)-methyltransferase [Zavarzinella formosa]